MSEVTRRWFLKRAAAAAATIGLVNYAGMGVAEAHHRPNHGGGNKPAPDPVPDPTPDPPPVTEPPAAPVLEVSWLALAVPTAPVLVVTPPPPITDPGYPLAYGQAA